MYFCLVKKPRILPDSFYTRPDVVQIAKELLGKVIVTVNGGVTTSGMIVETEAYAGITDRASHALGGRRTPRTEVMYARGGVAYVYLCYGIHHLFNVVTNREQIPHAVLVRGIQPIEGLDAMIARRSFKAMKRELTAGPGALSRALGITTRLSGASLTGAEIRIEERGLHFDPESIVSATRIGVDYAGDDAQLPYRFYVKDNQYVSRL